MQMAAERARDQMPELYAVLVAESDPVAMAGMTDEQRRHANVLWNANEMNELAEHQLPALVGVSLID